MNLLYYRKEREQFSDQADQHLSDDEARYAFKRLRSHYKLPHRLEVWGNRGGGHCNSWRVHISHNTTVLTLAHEVAHAVQFKRRAGRDTGGKWHTKEHRGIMKRVVRYITTRLPAWKAQVEKNCQRHMQSSVSRIEKEKQTLALKRTPAYRLEHLRKLEKKAYSRVRRATTHLKKIQQRIKIWEKKASPVSFI
jgi:hypothetical protein